MKRLFGTSGIRGVFGQEVTPELATSVGLALGTQIKTGKVLIGRDPRTTSLALENAIVSGLESTGVHALRAGLIPTPVLAFSTRALGCDAGVMITASHNPPEYNGIKLWSKSSMAFPRRAEEKIESAIETKKFRRVDWRKVGHSLKINVINGYIHEVKKFVRINKKFNIVLDCGNGANSVVSPLILKEYSKKLKCLFCDPDGAFPNRKPEPVKENLKELIKEVKKQQADLGVAHDGDGDRIALIDEKGEFVDKDKLLALLAKNEIKKGSKVIVPVDTSKLVEDVVKENGGKVLMCRVGDVAVAEKLISQKGRFGGEPSGCFIFPEFSFCPDGILSSLKILELMSKTGKKLSELVEELPNYYTVRKVIKCKNSEKEKLVEKYSKKLKRIEGIRKIIQVDGTRVDFKDAWALVRASGTEPKIRITVEARNRTRANGILKELLEHS